MCVEVEVSFKHPSIIILFALATLVRHLMRCCSQVSIEMQETMLLLLAFSTLHANVQTSIHNYHFQQSALFVLKYTIQLRKAKGEETHSFAINARQVTWFQKMCFCIRVCSFHFVFSLYESLQRNAM